MKDITKEAIKGFVAGFSAALGYGLYRVTVYHINRARYRIHQRLVNNARR